MFFFKLLICFKNSGFYLYIYIDFSYILSFDLALLCKFSSNTSGTALGVGVGEGPSSAPLQPSLTFRVLWRSAEAKG